MNAQTLSFALPILILLLLWAIWKKFKTSSKLLNLPPGPRKLRIIGNLHQLIGVLPHHKFRDLANKYGSVVQLQFGEVSAVIISSPESAKQVLQTHDIIFAHRPFLLAADVMLYKAADLAFAPYGDYYRQLRKICVLELLSSKRVQLFRSIREEEVSNFIRSISSGAGSPINLSKMLRSSSCAITVRAAFGNKNPLDQEEIIPLIPQILPLVSGLRLADLFPSFKLLHAITRFQYRLKTLHKKVDLVLEKIINGHRIARATSKINTEDEDVLHVLLNLQEQGNLALPLTDDNIKAFILDIFLGGIDSPSTVIEWAMAELIKSPKVMRKVQAEVRQVFDSKAIVDETIIGELKYLKFVIKETLRLHPPAPLLLPREAREQCQISGFDIPTKTRVFVNVWALGRDPNYWFEAERFFPERFIESPIEYKGGNFEYLPFGSGRRICPGSLFGLAYVELALAHLLYRFDWELPNAEKNEDLNMDEEFTTVARRKNDLHLIHIPYHHLPTAHGSPTQC